jgi:hypothetical protein
VRYITIAKNEIPMQKTTTGTHPADLGEGVGGCIEDVADTGKSEVGVIPDEELTDVKGAICNGLGEFFGTEVEDDDGLRMDDPNVSAPHYNAPVSVHSRRWLRGRN